LALAALGAGGCKTETQTQTTVPATWRSSELPRDPFTHVFVIGVGRNDDYRRLYEDTMVRALAAEGVAAQASSDLFPQTSKLEKAKVLVAVEERGFDGVVIARLKSIREEEEYVPAAPLTSSDLYMSGYDKAYAVNSSPAHYEQNTTYRVETTLYSARDQMLAWVALSDTVNPHSVEDVIQSVSTRVVAQMKAEGLIAVPPSAR
jgi:hypothetical protein